MNKITLQFVTERGLSSSIIRWFTWSLFSHVDAVLDDGRLLGARLSGGVQIRPANYARFTRVGRFAISVTSEQHRLFWRFLYQQIGKKYDWRAILNFGLHGRDPYFGNRWFCDELQAAALERIGKRPFNRCVPVTRFTPRDLAISPIWEEISIS